MKKVCNMVHGSHLYGLNTERSDMDYKGVFMPAVDDLILGTASHEVRHSTGAEHAKNTSDDVDTVYYSLQKFIKMACDGETIAIDMLHCNDKNLLETSPVWKEIVENRHRFYTKNMKAFLGYCRKQAAKYGVRGSRLKAMEDVLEYLKSELAMHGDQTPELRMNSTPRIELTLKMIANEHSKYVKVVDSFYKGEKKVERKVVEVCEAKYDFTTSVQYVVTALQKKFDSYGHRAQQAKNNEGIDWKAMSHALRAGLQLKEIYETGDLKYPLKDREFLLKVKNGELDFTTVVSPALEDVIDEVERLAAASTLPDAVDRKFWDDFVVRIYKENSNL